MRKVRGNFPSTRFWFFWGWGEKDWEWNGRGGWRWQSYLFVWLEESWGIGDAEHQSNSLLGSFLWGLLGCFWGLGFGLIFYSQFDRSIDAGTFLGAGWDRTVMLLFGGVVGKEERTDGGNVMMGFDNVGRLLGPLLEASFPFFFIYWIFWVLRERDGKGERVGDICLSHVCVLGGANPSVSRSAVV